MSNGRITSTKVSSLTVAGEDFLPFYTTVEIFEDVFSFFMTGIITIMDPMSWTDELPLLGGETVNIEFKEYKESKSSLFSKEFKVSSITDITSTETGTERRFYRIHIVTPKAFNNYNTRIARTYKKGEDGIVKNICEKILKIENIETEAVKNIKKITIPNLTPLETISLCCETALRQKTEACNYLFFEDMDSHYFKSFDSLIEAGKKFTLTNEVQREGTQPRDDFPIYNAQSFQLTESFDWFKNANNGVWGRRFIGINYFDKKYIHKDYVYSSHFDKMAKIDGDNNKLTEETKDFPEQAFDVGPFLPNPKVNYESEYANEYRHFYPSHHNILKNYRLEVDIDGNADIRVGQVAEVNLPRYRHEKEEEGEQKKRKKGEYDKKISGNWLVVNVRHIFNSTEHRTTLGLCKPHVLSD